MRRKNWIRLFALALPVLFLLFAAERETWAALPKTYQEFKARYQKEGRTPEGAAKLYFEAVFCYLDPATRDEASKMVRYALHSSQPIEQSYNLATFVERLKYPEYHHIFRGFAEGTSPENDYRMSPDNFNLVVVKKTQEQGYLRLFLRNSGADSPAPVWMQEFDGLWYMINNASTYVQVRPPRSELDRTKNAHDADYDVRKTPQKPDAPIPSGGGGTPETSDSADGGETEKEDDGEFVFK